LWLNWFGIHVRTYGKLYLWVQRMEIRMIQIMTKFEVEDFPKWKTNFLAAESIRVGAGGSKVAQVFQRDDNPKMVIVITEWDSLEKAKAYSQSPALREAQQKSGTLTKPEAYKLESV
jgi:heme-degrading monooxygenase HmoA